MEEYEHGYEHLVPGGIDPEVAKRWADQMVQDRQAQERVEVRLHHAAIRESIKHRRKGCMERWSGGIVLLIVGLVVLYFGYRILSGNESW